MKTGQNFYLSLLAILFILTILIYRISHVNRPNLWLTNKTIDKFSISGNLIYQDKDDGWLMKIDGLDSQPVDQDLVNYFVKGLKQLNLDNLVSNNQDNYQIYGINNNSPEVLVDNQKLLVGNLGKSFDTSYVEILDKKGIYEIPQIWGNKEIAKSNYWKVKFVNNLSIYQIEKVEVLGKTIKPENGKWLQADSINSLAYLKTISFLGKNLTKQKDFLAFKITNNDSSVVNLEIGQNGNNFWASKGKYFYSISKEDFDLLTRLVK